MDKKKLFYNLGMCLIIVILGVSTGMLGHELNKEYNFFDKIMLNNEMGVQGLDSTTVDSLAKECEDITRIDKRLECVRTHIERFYNYEIRDDDEKISFKELMNEGGDCGNWAIFWEYIGDVYDYEITPIRIGVDDTTTHRFSILSNYQGYCRVDQTQLDCFVYG